MSITITVTSETIADAMTNYDISLGNILTDVQKAVIDDEEAIELLMNHLDDVPDDMARRYPAFHALLMAWKASAKDAFKVLTGEQT